MNPVMSDEVWMLVHTHEGGITIYPFLFVPEDQCESPVAEDAAVAMEVFFEPDRGETVELHTFALDDMITFLYGNAIVGLGDEYKEVEF